MHFPFRIKGQGVCVSGEVKNRIVRSLSESDMRTYDLFVEARGMKVPGVTGATPETARSSRGQGEAELFSSVEACRGARVHLLL